MIKYNKFEEFSKLIDDLSLEIELKDFNVDEMAKSLMITYFKKYFMKNYLKNVTI